MSMATTPVGGKPISPVAAPARHAHPEAAPLGGKIFTPSFLVLVGLFGLGGVVMLYRFFVGLGPISNLTEGYAWGIWKPLNVVVATSIGAGGYGTALVVYVLNRGHYHPLVRPALLTSALAYTVGAASVLVDLGRWWNILKIPGYVWHWNGNSVLLEVSMCVLTYWLVLWVESSPAFFEQGEKARPSGWQRFSARVLPGLRKAMPYIIALGVLLPTMHQSSLGGLFMLSTKLNGLWHTGYLPALFLLSCLMMGYAGIIIQDSVTRLILKAKQENDLLPRLAQFAMWLSFSWIGLRFVDLAIKGRLGAAFAFDYYSWFFLAENVLAIAGAALLIPRAYRVNPGIRFASAFLLIMSGTLYRFDTYLVGITPLGQWSYFPSLGEIAVSISLWSMAVAIFVLVAKRFPIIIRPGSVSAGSH